MQLSPASLAITAPRGRGYSGPTDPSWANVVTLMHFEGPAFSSTFTDTSSVGVSASGPGCLLSTLPKFGSACLFVTTSGALTLTAPGSQYNFSSGDFTIELWFNAVTSNLSRAVFMVGDDSAAGGMGLFANASGNLIVTVGGTSLATGVAAPASGSYAHIAVVSSAGTVSLYVGGTRVYTFAATPSSSTFTVGKSNVLGANADTIFIDELRITKGVARYTGASFTVPTAAFPNA